MADFAFTNGAEKPVDVEAPPRPSTSSSFPTSPTPDALRARLSHFTWAWYTLSMATGGIALLLHPATQPHTFDGLLTIGKVVFVLDLVIFMVITMCMCYRFATNPGTFMSSLTHPTESLFASTSFISLASIIACMARYGIPATGPWLVVTFRVLFWIYYAVTWLVAIIQYVHLFTNPSLRIQDMTPAWDLPIFPVMLSGTVAAVGAATQPAHQAVPMIVAGTLAQGLGFLISILMYASYVRRMIQYGFPSPASRPAMFIAVGPPSFTALALIGMANAWPADPHYDFFGSVETTGVVLRVIAFVTAVFIWSLGFWFFCVGVVSTLMVARELKFKLNWNAFVFPNVGFTISVISIGKVLRSEGVMWVGSVMSILIVGLYLFVQVMCVRAVWTKQVLYEGRDEDVYHRERKGKNEKRLAAGDGHVLGGSDKDD
jgi:C4-dicarboxylate transporter/malic acid transport protein